MSEKVTDTWIGPYGVCSTAPVMVAVPVAAGLLADGDEDAEADEDADGDADGDADDTAVLDCELDVAAAALRTPAPE
ncbi:MAG: hypothetical protein ABI310_10965 [Microbacteriaceae bacterium]